MTKTRLSKLKLAKQCKTHQNKTMAITKDQNTLEISKT